MDLKQLKAKISESFGEDEFYELIRDEGYDEESKRFEAVVGLPFKFVETERYNASEWGDGYAWRFKIGDKLYQIDGSYSSWDGTEMESAMRFYEVHAVKKTITVYEAVK